LRGVGVERRKPTFIHYSLTDAHGGGNFTRKSAKGGQIRLTTGSFGGDGQLARRTRFEAELLHQERITRHRGQPFMQRSQVDAFTFRYFSTIHDRLMIRAARSGRCPRSRSDLFVPIQGPRSGSRRIKRLV
jgi:hypothetical protein